MSANDLRSAAAASPTPGHTHTRVSIEASTPHVKRIFLPDSEKARAMCTSDCLLTVMEVWEKLGHNESHMNPDIAEALNEQIRKEFNAAFLYLSFSVNMKDYGMRGAGKWLRVQYREECGHALRLLDYMELRRVPVRVPSITSPEYTWERPLDIFRLAWEHERMITQAIYSLVSLCEREQDYATKSLLMHYVDEQLEEESQVEEIVAALQRCGNDESALLQLDMRLENARSGDEKVWAI